MTLPTTCSRHRADFRVLSFVARWVIGGVLLWAVISKLFGGSPSLRGVDFFAATIAAHELVPRSWAPAAAWGVIALEFALGVLLIGSVRGRVPSLAAAGLFAIFTAYVVIAQRKQGSVPCGCLGQLTPSDVDWVTTRNAALIGLCLLGASFPDRVSRPGREPHPETATTPSAA